MPGYDPLHSPAFPPRVTSRRRAIIVGVLTLFGATAVTFMMVMYALERRHPGFVLAFACGCALSSAYGFLAGTWPFGVVEAIWAAVAVHRYADHHRRRAHPPS